jgi:hypothetical protein
MNETPLKRILREDGRKQNWLAEQTGVSPAQLSRIVNGLQCDEATRQAIADALGRSVSEVFAVVTADDESVAA